MRFFNYHCDVARLPSPSNLLVLFIDSNDPSAEEPVDVLFNEALGMTANGANLHWFRPKPCRRLPSMAQGAVLRPDHLSRIRLHYGYEKMYVLLQSFCTKTLYINAKNCTALFVEFQEDSASLTDVECAALLALLANTANWIAARRAAFGRKEDPTFPVVLLLRDSAKHRFLSSMCTHNALVWRSQYDWKDLFEWERRDLDFTVMDEPLPK